MKLSTMFRGQEVLAKLLEQIILTLKEQSRLGELFWPMAHASAKSGFKPHSKPLLQAPKALIAHLHRSRATDGKRAPLPAELRSYLCFNTAPACACYRLRASSNAHLAEMRAFGYMPLQVLELEQLVVYRSRTQRGLPHLSGQLPFGLDQHPAAKSELARAMLRRLREDVSHHAQQQNKLLLPHMAGLAKGEFNRSLQGAPCLPQLLWQVERFVHMLIEQRRCDVQRLIELVALALKRVNYIDDAHAAVLSSRGSDVDARAASAKAQRAAQLRSFALARVGGVESELSFEQLVSLVAMQDAIALIQAMNPFLSSKRAEEALEATILAMLTANRVSQVLECLEDATRLHAYLEQLVALGHQSVGSGSGAGSCASGVCNGGADADELERAAFSKADLLAAQLTARRHYMVESPPQGSSSADGRTYTLDPRMLIFEFRHELLLREVQVALLKRFSEAYSQGRSLCHQLIMGQGKTTVIAPLLSIMIADGDRLVVSVVPLHLLMMMNHVLTSVSSEKVGMKQLRMPA